MSESENEFGTLAPTTPLVPVRKGTRTKKPIAGPSKGKGRPPPPKNAKLTPDSSELEYLDEHEEGLGAVVASGHHVEEEMVHSDPPPKQTKGRKAATRTEDVVTDGDAGVAKGKTKGKAKPSRRNAKPVNSKAVEYYQPVDDTEGESAAALRRTVPSNAAGKSRNVDTSTEVSKSERALDRLRQKLQDVEAQRDALSHQLEELFRVRNTEAEQILEQQTLQYETRIQTQEALIAALTEQVTRAEPLTRSGKGFILDVIPRDKADEEKRVVERDLAQLRDVAGKKDTAIAERDKQIAELEQSLHESRAELKAEIERSKFLVSNPSRKTASQTHGRTPSATILGNDNPKNTEVIRLYEDLTNLLIPGLKFTTGRYFSLTEANFTCVYTFVPDSQSEELDSEDKGKSLSFVLRFYHDKEYRDDPEPVSANDLVEWVEYTPLELDKESSEFVEGLQQLSTPFSFKREQLARFLNAIRANMAVAEEDAEEMEVEDN